MDTDNRNTLQPIATKQKQPKVTVIRPSKTMMQMVHYTIRETYTRQQDQTIHYVEVAQRHAFVQIGFSQVIRNQNSQVLGLFIISFAKVLARSNLVASG
jgi:hypothetical protein